MIDRIQGRLSLINARNRKHVDIFKLYASYTSLPLALWLPVLGFSKNSEHDPVFKLSRNYYAKIVILAQGVPPEGVCPLMRESSAPT